MPAPKGTRLVQRGDVWYIVWTGNTRGRSTRTRDRGVAEVALAEFIRERERDGAVGGLTVAAALDFYREEHVMAVRDDGTPLVVARDRLYFVRQDDAPSGALVTLADHFGSVLVADVTDDLVDLYVTRRRSGALGRPAKDSTIRRELGALVAAFNHSAAKNVKPRRIHKNDLPTIALPEEPPSKDRWLTPKEAKDLRDACQPAEAKTLTRVARFVAIALATAARKRSIERLTWFQVDFERGIIQFNPPGARQTKKRRVPVPISDELRPVLDRAFAERGDASHVLGEPGAIRKAFAAAVERAGLKKVTPHTLRHTWATWAAQRGVPMEQIAAVLGDDERTVRAKYIHWSPEHLRDAVNFGRAADVPVQKERPNS